MTEFYPYRKLASYPHMGPKDKAIWDRFIEKYPDAYDRCQYDLEVGSGPEFDTVVNAATGGDVKKLYQYKIDVVGFHGPWIHLIEVKPDAKGGAFGQLFLEEHLYNRTTHQDDYVQTVLVTDRETADIRSFADAVGVQLYVV